MEGKKQTVFVVSIGKGYKQCEVVFSDIQKATEFFKTLTAQPLPILSEISKDKKVAHHITSVYEVKIETQEVMLYTSKKAADFAVHGDGIESEE